MESNFTRSESDLLVFISSVMDDELAEARCIVQKALREESQITRPWAFEFTPASSTSSEEEYLEKVRCADFVIWLVGSKTTLPVVNEINTCIDNSCRLLVFKLPTICRDEQTCNLLSKVKNHVKWKEVDDIDRLAKDVKDSISDEIIKALRDPAPPSRKRRIEESYNNSISRCKQMWRTLNISDNTATKLSKDLSVGDVLGSPCAGLYIICGDQGSGKTLAAERLFQRWIKQSLYDSSRPFPLFIKSMDLKEPLNEYFNRMTQGYSSFAIQGAAIIIDGIDEIGLTRANSLLEQSKVFADANPKSIVIITSRRLPGLKIDDIEQIDIPTMDDEQITDLISKIAECGVDRVRMYTWSESIRDAVRRPLFAIMMGIELSDDPEFIATRPSQLVNLLAQKAAKNAEEKDWLLQKLASEIVKAGTRVSKSAISRKLAEQNVLIDSRLVNEQEGKLDFTLSIFREFYAARAIIEDTISIDSIMPVSDRWLIPLAIVMEEDKEIGNELINKIVLSDLGFASLLLKELVNRWSENKTDVNSLGTTEEVGQKIWDAMDTWHRSLGELFSIIGPLSPKGHTATLGIHISNSEVVTSWYQDTDTMPPVVELQIEKMLDMNFSSQNISYITDPKYWPWVKTRDYLARKLTKAIESNYLTLGSNDAVRELVWDFSRKIYNSSVAKTGEININEILHFIEGAQHSNEFLLWYFNGVQIWNWEIKSIKCHLMELLEHGVNTISEPWPSGDQTMSSDSGLIWDNYSGQRLLDRTNAIYTGALDIYQKTIDQWLEPFDKQLQLVRPHPARLEGGLVLPDRQDIVNTDPILTRIINPLPAGEKSIAAFEIMSKEMCDNFIREYKEGKEVWNYSSGILLQLFEPRPATEIACKWLISDLRNLGWA